jgi:hypothetical protein
MGCVCPIGMVLFSLLLLEVVSIISVVIENTLACVVDKTSDSEAQFQFYHKNTVRYRRVTASVKFFSFGVGHAGFSHVKASIKYKALSYA